MTIVEAATTATTTNSSIFEDDGLLQGFLARLSGRRRHVRSVSRPGAAASSGSQTGPSPQPASNSSSSSSMDQEVCPRCRCGQSCSCAFLGLEDDAGGRRTAEPLRRPPPPQQQHECRRAPGGRRAEGAGPSGTGGDNSSGARWCTAPGCEDRDVLRRRPPEQQRSYSRTAACTLATLFIISFLGVADACSSRSTPKPRPPTPTPTSRPNITFHMYACPSNYAEWYCLNGATCFTVKIVDSLLYNCLCSNGFIGQRCEFKDLDGSYLPSRQRIMLETASIAGAVTIAVFLAVIAFISIYIHCKRKQKELRMSSGVDAVDGPGRRDPELRPFCSRSRSLMIFMAKNPHHSSATAPSIEHTRMPNPAWSYPAESSTRMASINENKRPSQ